MTQVTPFDIANNIYEKKGILDLTVVKYEPFMVNRILSNNPDTVLFANEMNQYWAQLDRLQQYHFFYYGIPKKKRYGKWHKNEDDKRALELIQWKFGYSIRKAKEALPLLKSRLHELEAEYKKGGKCK